MSAIRDKVIDSVASLWREQTRARDAVRRSYQSNRWQTATTQERAAARRNFRINLARRRELQRWLNEEGGK